MDLHYAKWRSGVQFTERRGWTATLYLDGETRQLALGPAAAQGDNPAAQIPGCLDRLGADGWRVLHVSQDTQVGPPPRYESRVTAIRFLLVREAGQQAGTSEPGNAN
jgi:hypothetical protein